MLYRKKTINNVATLENLSGAPKVQGVPLGTWASFENGVAPGNCWLEAGTTFDPEEYPAAYMYLNDTTVPERFDHSKLSEWESITISTNSASPTVMQYDGILSISQGYGSSMNVNVYINGVRISSAGGNNLTLAQSLSFKKNDEIYLSITGGGVTQYVSYYKQHLFFKATSELDSEQATSVFNSMKHLNDYSTEETLTGGTWIDGKPIYRKVISDGLVWVNDEWRSNSSATFAALNLDTVISTHFYTATRKVASVQLDQSAGGVFSLRGEGTTVSDGSCIIEYTKTTDTAPGA